MTLNCVGLAKFICAFVSVSNTTDGRNISSETENRIIYQFYRNCLFENAGQNIEFKQGYNEHMMNILSSLLTRIDTKPEYICEFCGQRYEEDRLNCHACGFDVVARNR